MSSTDFELFKVHYDNEGKSTDTTEAKDYKDEKILKVMHKKPEMLVDEHYNYLKRVINPFKPLNPAMESGLPSMALYTLAPIAILGLDKKEEYPSFTESVIKMLNNRKTNFGGFSGLHEEHPNAVVTMLSVAALAIIGTEEAYKVIDKEMMYKMLLDLKNEDGSFSASKNMEKDLRSTYSALTIASMLGILTPELTKNVLEFTLKCFNYDGGFSPIPHTESHGGYVHCGVGILNMLGHLDDINLNKVIRYIAMRQDNFSGGFNGRTNKLVDSCYSWWIGTSARILADHLNIPSFWNVDAMSSYILQCSQGLFGGFCDSPPNRSDPFHTCFGLSGLCMVGSGKLINKDLIELDYYVPVPKDKMEKMKKYFETH